MRIKTFIVLSLLISSMASCGKQRRQDFTFDPRWDGLNNRSDKTPHRTTMQDFGYSATTTHAGGAAGEVGGLIQMAADTAYYAAKLPKPLTFNDRISASGKIAFPDPQANGAFLLGFFNAETAAGWRTPNTLALRFDHRGNCLHGHMEYCTSRWRAGGDFFGDVDSARNKRVLRELPLAGVHQWWFKYEPAGNNGGGTIAFAIDDHQMSMNLDPGHKADGATFNRFGALNIMKSSDNRVKFYIDDLTINGQKEDFSHDPQWEAVGNHRPTFEDPIVRFRFDFGFSKTNFAGGWPGEVGGIVFRGDDRSPEKMAYYGDRLEPLTLKAPLTASGRIALTRGITDSTTLFGWFHSERSLQPGRQDIGVPRHFLGIMVEGPSSDGFLFRPCFRAQEEYGFERGPIILPDGKPHRWELRYTPNPNGQEGTITLSLDGQSTTLPIEAKHALATAEFNRFGFITTLIDGNCQYIYYDDLEYTYRQDNNKEK